jgi:hypothetical protein
MSHVGFEPTNSVFEGTKTVHILDRAVTVIGSNIYVHEIPNSLKSIKSEYIFNSKMFCI